MHIVVVASDLANNSLGRVYCLWLLARDLGWRCDVVATRGEHVWGPLDGTPFAADCHLATDAAAAADLAAGADLVVAAKPFPTSLGVAVQVARRLDRPVLLDVDDPDLELALTSGYSVTSTAKRVARELLKARYMAGMRRMRVLARTVPAIASNPHLAATYGADVIPHVRPVPPADDWVAPRPDGEVRVAFVGTVRAHKGVAQLRRAVAGLAGEGFRLTLTAPAPRRPAPWERWVGVTSLDEGRRLVADSDVVVIPSVRTVYSEGQLPAKLVDAMLAGRAVVASDVPPVRWALGGTGVLVPPGDLAALTTGLRALRDPQLRVDLGLAARERARQEFTTAGVADRFADVCTRATQASPARTAR